MKRRTALIIIVLLLFFFSANAQVDLHEQFGGMEGVKISNYQGREIAHAEDKIHIKLLDNEYAVSLVPEVLGQTFEEITSPFNKLGWGVVRVRSDADYFQLIEDLDNHPEVLSAVPLSVGNIAAPPNDNDFERQWSLKNTGQPPTYGEPGADIDFLPAWDFKTWNNLDNVVVAVLDTGIPIEFGSLSHPELQDSGRIILGPSYYTATVRDDHGHGTHVAGIIAAETNNNTGIAGIAGDAGLLIIKTNRFDGHFTCNTFQNGVIYASDYADSTGKRVIVNFSSGDPKDRNVILMRFNMRPPRMY